jgi:hypothetical protein
MWRSSSRTSGQRLNRHDVGDFNGRRNGVDQEGRLGIVRLNYQVARLAIASADDGQRTKRGPRKGIEISRLPVVFS